MNRREINISEIKFQIEPKTILGFIIIFVGLIAILEAVLRAFWGIEFTDQITEGQQFNQILAWFFGLLIQILGGLFLGVIGTRITKK